MAQVSFTNYANVINKYIAPMIKVQVYSTAPTWLMFGGWNGLTTKMSQDFMSRTNVPGIQWVNNTLFFDVQTGLSSGSVSIPTGDNLQNGVIPFGQANLPLTTATNSYNIPKQLMNLKRGAGAIAGTMEKYGENLTTGMASDLNRQSIMDGTGNLAFYGISSTNSVTPATFTPITSSGTSQYFIVAASPNQDLNVSRYFPPQTVVQMQNISGSTITATTNFIVLSTSVSSGLVTVNIQNGSVSNPTFTAAATTRVVKLSGSNNPAIELTGLLSIIGNGAYAGLTDSNWVSYVNTNGGVNKALALGDVNLAYNTITGLGFGRPDVILSNITEYTQAQNLMYNQLRFSTKDTFYGGTGGIEWGGGSATWFLESDMPDDRIFLLTTADLFKGEYQGLEIEPGTKGDALRVPGTLNYEIAADWMGQIGTMRRGTQGVLSNRVG